jgi:hypothetical protein
MPPMIFKLYRQETIGYSTHGALVTLLNLNCCFPLRSGLNRTISSCRLDMIGTFLNLKPTKHIFIDKYVVAFAKASVWSLCRLPCLCPIANWLCIVIFHRRRPITEYVGPNSALLKAPNLSQKKGNLTGCADACDVNCDVNYRCHFLLIC